VQDVAIKEKLGYEAVVGIIDRHLASRVDWSQFERLEVLGLAEIALKKGHSDYGVIVSARLSNGQLKLLAVLPNREKDTVKTFLARIPTRLKRTIHTVCTDMWQAYINAAKEVLGQVVVVVDRYHLAKKYRDWADNLRKQELRRLKPNTTPSKGPCGPSERTKLICSPHKPSCLSVYSVTLPP